MDFTVSKYEQLIDALVEEKYVFQTFAEYLKSPDPNAIILRHDVDLLPYHSLKFAKLQAERNIKGVYYFRAVPESWNEKVIKEINNLGHEVGYHYECLTTCNGDINSAIEDFRKNLEALRKLVPVSTVCMHGSPLSKYDSRKLWTDRSYRDFDIIGEPYFSLNFDKVFYLTDTGRRWDGNKYSVRDKVNSVIKLSFNSTDEIIQACRAGKLPSQIMFTFHPQRWHDNKLMWLKELITQNIKNTIKQLFFVRSNQ